MKNIKYIVAGLVLIVVIVAIALVRPTENSRQPGDNSVPVSTIAEPDPNGANIQVTSPKPGDVVGPSVVTIKGFARVFESQFRYRVLDADGTKLAEDSAMSNAPDAGQFGAFSITATIAPTGDRGTVEVFDISAKDGSEIDLVSVPVNFAIAPSGS